jgi:hypothetical protein
MKKSKQAFCGGAVIIALGFAMLFKTTTPSMLQGSMVFLMIGIALVMLSGELAIRDK